MVFKHVFSAIAIVGAAAVPLGAAGQSEKVKTETKLEVKDGKDVTLTGCLERVARVERRDDAVPVDQRRRQEE